MSIIKTIITCAYAMLVMADLSQARGWRGIVPLHSTRAEVERLLGAPKESRGVASTYDTKNERVNVSYSDGVCKKGNSDDWNVPRDTVVSFTVHPNSKLLVDDLNLDKTKYEKQRDPHLEGIVYYINREEGVFIDVRILDGGVEDVDNITYESAATDDHLRCPGTPSEPSEGDGKVYDPHIRKFDEYSDIPFEDEKPRLENLAINLQREPQMKGYIIVYAGRRARAGEAKARAARAKNYLVNELSVEAERIITIDGGYREKLEVELYALPHGVPAPISPTVDPSEVQSIKTGSARKNNRHAPRPHCKQY
jgi:hypothetical protein